MLKSILQSCIPSAVFLRRLPTEFTNHVLLTFDDGPHPEATPAILETLQQYNARAIFFVVGDRIDRAPELLKAINDQGHALGNHSYSHPMREPFRYRAYCDELARCDAEIHRHVSAPVYYHRPPLGSISFATAVAPRQQGLRTVLWSCSAEDWRFASDADAVTTANQLSQTLRPRDILLMHDEKLFTVTLLQHLLPALVERGLRFDVAVERKL